MTIIRDSASIANVVGHRRNTPFLISLLSLLAVLATGLLALHALNREAESAKGTSAETGRSP